MEKKWKRGENIAIEHIIDLSVLYAICDGVEIQRWLHEERSFTSENISPHLNQRHIKGINEIEQQQFLQFNKRKIARENRSRIVPVSWRILCHLLYNSDSNELN